MADVDIDTILDGTEDICVDEEGSRFDNFMSRLQYLKGMYENKISEKNKLEAEVYNLSKEKEILTKSEKVLKHLADKLVKKDLSKMDALITYGLRTVYSDRDIKFKSNIVERGKKIKIELKTIYNGSTLDTQSMSSVHVIESFLLRLLCIIKMNRAKFLLLDETFSALDSGYIENLGNLIIELCKKLNMDVFLVTHNQGFIDFGENIYKISNSDKKTSLIKVK